MFFDTRTDSTFPGTPPDSTIFLCSHRFEPLLVLVRTVFGYSYGLYLFTILTRILPFFGTLIDSSLFRYSWEQFLDSRTDSTFSRYTPGFYHFSVLLQIRPFSDTRGDNFWILARIPSFPRTGPDSIIFRYSHRFDPFPVLVGKVF